jgi:cysteinyl-tRNA synthetase
MIRMISTLLERGYAYAEGADVYFSVESFRDYGRLSGRKLEDMKAGSRIAVDENKRHPMDFVLWKGVKPGEPQWPSPWGPGRPGWHLECSVMSNHFLGPSFDIHGGGRDLLFPHHENERAQSLGANDGTFARYWVHNGFVTVESEKMSKSLGNFITIRDALKTYHPEVLRLFLLSKHYRSPLDFSKSAVAGLQSGLVRIYRTLKRMEEVLGPFEDDPGDTDRNAETGPAGGSLPHGEFAEGFLEMMDDDLNTAGAVGLIFEKVREINKSMDAINGDVDQDTRERLIEERRSLMRAGKVLGLFKERPDEFFSMLSGPGEGVDSGEVERMIQERARAKADKDWARADGIRDQLKEMGIILEDGPEGTVWRFDV